MRYFIILLLTILSSTLFAQEKYRLFLEKDYDKTQTSFLINSLVRTDQVFVLETKNGIQSLKNESLEFTLENPTKVYFDGKFEGEFLSQIIFTYTNINLIFYEIDTEYFFFKLYSENEKY